MRVCLFEDHGVGDLEPLTLTRPVFDLLCGTTPLATKQTQYFAPCSAGALVRPFLAGSWPPARPDLPVNDAAWLRLGPVILVNGRWLPPGDNAGRKSPLPAHASAWSAAKSPSRSSRRNTLAGCTAATLDSFLERLEAHLCRAARRQAR